MSWFMPLTIEEVIQCVEAIPSLFRPGLRLTADEIGDGNMNFVFRVTGHDRLGSQSVILKQALPYMRSVGAAWPLTADRIRVEYEALTTQNELCPSLVPKVYHYDNELSLIVMEDLSTHSILREGLISEMRYPSFALKIGLFLARMLFLTSSFALGTIEMESNRMKFANPDMMKITSDFIFTFPFVDHGMNRYNPVTEQTVQGIWGNRKLQDEVDELKKKFNTDAQALIHGDLHTGSIMVTEQDVKVIDPEFAFYGPRGFDIGMLIANLLLSYCSHDTHPNCGRSKDYQMYLLRTIELIWLNFETEFRNLWEETGPHGSVQIGSVLVQLLQDSLGFAGCEMIRRVIGTSHVPDLEEIEDPSQRVIGETLALRIGQHMILQRSTVRNVLDFIALVQHIS